MKFEEVKLFILVGPPSPPFLSVPSIPTFMYIGKQLLGLIA